MRFCAFTGFITFRLEATERPARACLARCVTQYSPHRLYSTGTFVIEERNRIYRESTQATFVRRSLIFPIFQSTRRITATSFVHKNWYVENFYSILCSFVRFILKIIYSSPIIVPQILNRISSLMKINVAETDSSILLSDLQLASKTPLLNYGI